MEREYIVVVKRGVDLQEFDNDMIKTTGDGRIPKRSVDMANPRPGSRRMTHYMLTSDEAYKLQFDPRVLSVEIPPEERDDITLGLNAFQTADFTKPTIAESNLVNWGLRRCIDEANNYGTDTTIPGEYLYALDGTGVDVVIQDSGIEADHPEWQDRYGNSRLQQIDWYTESGLSGTQNINHYRDFDGHGTHCAGIAAGKTYGWAKNSHIYAQKLAGLEGSGDTGTGISISDAFDAIRLWHLAKTNGRPTVVNMSWGYSSRITGDPSSINYRGNAFSYTNAAAAWVAYGLVPEQDGIRRTIPARVASVDAEIEDMIDAGIHIVVASGNNYYKADVSTGLDYNNSVVYGSEVYFYHRGSSPFSEEAFIVGNIDTDIQDDSGTARDKISETSTRGPAVNIYAPGTNIMSTLSNTSAYAQVDYPGDSNFKVGSISGTSMAAPQVAGLIALHLQATPKMTTAEMKKRIEQDSKGVIFSTGSDTDYNVFGTSLLGSPNRMLWSRYGRQPFSFSGTTNFGGNIKL